MNTSNLKQDQRLMRSLKSFFQQIANNAECHLQQINLALEQQAKQSRNVENTDEESEDDTRMMYRKEAMFRPRMGGVTKKSKGFVGQGFKRCKKCDEIIPSNSKACPNCSFSYTLEFAKHTNSRGEFAKHTNASVE